MIRRRFYKTVGLVWLSASMALAAFGLAFLLILVSIKGLGALSWSISAQSAETTAGGVWPAVVGTFWITMVSALLSFPLGLPAGVYLNEYLDDGFIKSVIRGLIRNLAGVSPVVYGLVGLLLFVDILGVGISVWAAGMTLGLMTLPSTIAFCGRTLEDVDPGYRESALALGATRLQSVTTAVLPHAWPRIASGVVFTLAGAAGSTAPILFTGAAFYMSGPPESLGDRFMALPYRLYVLTTQHADPAGDAAAVWATAASLLLIVLSLNFLAVFIRYRFGRGANQS